MRFKLSVPQVCQPQNWEQKPAGQRTGGRQTSAHVPDTRSWGTSLQSWHVARAVRALACRMHACMSGRWCGQERWQPLHTGVFYSGGRQKDIDCVC